MKQGRWTKAAMLRAVPPLLLGAMAVPALAQEAGENPYNTQLPRFAHLAPLEERAAELTLGVRKGAATRRETVLAWRALQEAALNTRLADGGPHPIAYSARIKIASELYALGENGPAREELEAGIAGLRPYQAHYPATWAEGLALLGVLMTQAGDGDAAWPLVVEGYEAFMEGFRARGEAGETQAIVMAKSNLEFSLSQIASRTGRAEESIAYQRLSLATREAALGPDHPDTISSYYGLAGALRRAGDFEEAERLARIAVQRAVDHVDPSNPSYARALEMLGIVLSQSGRSVEGTDYLVRALDLKREHEGTGNLVFGYGIHNLATVLLQRERYADALPLFVEAEALFREKQGENSPFAVGSLAYAGQIDYAEGRPADAVARFEQLEARLGEQSSDIDMRRRIAPDYARALIATDASARAERIAAAFRESVLSTNQPDIFLIRFADLLSQRARLAVTSGDTAPAVAAARALVELLESRRLADNRGRLGAEARQALDLAMEVATLAGDADLMLSAMALLGSSDIAAATSQRELRLRAADPAIESALRTMQEAQAAYERADGDLLAALAGNQGSEAARADLARASEVRDAAATILTGRFPAWSAAAIEAAAPNIATLQSRLAGDEALLAVVPGYAGTYLLAVDRKGASVATAPAGRARMIALVRSLRDDTITGSDGLAAAKDLSAAILPLGIGARLGQSKRLRIMAGGGFASLPFALLTWPDGDGSERLIDRFALANVGGFDFPARSDDRDRSIGRFAGFADPAPFVSTRASSVAAAPTRGIASFYERQGPDVDALARLPRLPRSRDEVRDIAGLFRPENAAMFVGEAASEATMALPPIERADVLLFATHGLVAGEIEGISEPALVLAAPAPGTSATDGLLTVSEIAGLDLSADWVILSACDSAAGIGGGLPAFSGLAQAFRFAGAGALLVTHWQVRDDAAAYVSRETLRGWLRHGDKSRALREAILALRDQSGLPGATSPAVWAPFALIDG